MSCNAAIERETVLHANNNNNVNITAKLRNAPRKTETKRSDFRDAENQNKAQNVLCLFAMLNDKHI